MNRFQRYRRAVEQAARSWVLREWLLCSALIALERSGTWRRAMRVRTFGQAMADPARLDVQGYSFDRYARLKPLVEAYPRSLFERLGIPSVRVYDRIRTASGRSKYAAAVQNWSKDHNGLHPSAGGAWAIARAEVPDEIEPVRPPWWQSELNRLRGLVTSITVERDRAVAQRDWLRQLARRRKCKIPAYPRSIYT